MLAKIPIEFVQLFSLPSSHQDPLQLRSHKSKSFILFNFVCLYKKIKGIKNSLNLYTDPNRIPRFRFEKQKK